MALYWIITAYFFLMYFIFYKIVGYSNVDIRTYKLSYRKFFLFITLGLLAILAMLRSESVGMDTKAYLEMYKLYGNKSLKSVISFKKEYLYFILNNLLYKVSKNPQTIIIVTGLITYALLYNVISKKFSSLREIFLSVILVYTIFFGFSVNTIRQAIAVVIVLYSYNYLERKNTFKFYIVCCVACLFHFTALVFFIAYPVVYSKKWDIIKIVSFACSAIIVVFYNFFSKIIFKIFPLYLSYVDLSYFDGKIRISTVVSVLFIAGILFIDYYFSNKNKNNQLLSKLIYIGFIINLLALRWNIFNRLSMYYMIFQLFFIPNTVNNIENKFLKKTAYVGFIAIFIVKAAMEFYLRPEWTGLFPYTMCI